MTKWSSKLSVAALAATLVTGVLAPATGSAESAKATPSNSSAETYTWSAELVAYDAANHAITVKSMLVSNPETADLSALRPGDRAMLTWSGITTAAGVRAVERGNSSQFDRMTMPIEFVGTELDGRYVSFKVPVPAAHADVLAKLEPGAYVTATSPLRAKNADDAVISIKPYSDAS